MRALLPGYARVLSPALLLLACSTPPDDGAPPSALTGTGDVQLAQWPGAPLHTSNGDLWFSTVQLGLLRFDGEAFTTYTTADGLPSNTIRDILELDGDLWVGTTGGVATLNLEQLDASAATPRFERQIDYAEQSPVKSMTPWGDSRDIWDVHRDSRGRTWITTMAGVYRWVDGRFERFPMPAVAEPGVHEFTPHMVYGVFEDRAGDLWFATDGAGAVRFDADLESSTVYTAATHGLAHDRVCDILQDASGAYWFGTSGGGVSRWSGVEGEPFTTHLQLAERSVHVGLGRVMELEHGADGAVWFGMAQQGGGAWRWRPEGATGGPAPSAADDATRAMFAPASHAPVANGAFTYFGSAHGLGGGIPSLDRDATGRVWFGTTEGVYSLDGDRFVHMGKAE